MFATHVNPHDLVLHAHVRLHCYVPRQRFILSFTQDKLQLSGKNTHHRNTEHEQSTLTPRPPRPGTTLGGLPVTSLTWFRSAYAFIWRLIYSLNLTTKHLSNALFCILLGSIAGFLVLSLLRSATRTTSSGSPGSICLSSCTRRLLLVNLLFWLWQFFVI